MPKLSLKDQDVILVEPQGPMINVAGKVRNPFRFELKKRNTQGSELIHYALPLAKVSHVGVIGDRPNGPIGEALHRGDVELPEIACCPGGDDHRSVVSGTHRWERGKEVNPKGGGGHPGRALDQPDPGEFDLVLSRR
jgi:hypothetical protein